MLPAADDYYYTLRDVMVFFENAELHVQAYRRMCVELRIAAVVEQDKQALKGYLTGTVDTAPQIDQAAAAAGAQEVLEQSKKSGEESVGVGAAGGAPGEPGTVAGMSSGEMEVQRQRHVARIEQSLQRPATVNAAQPSGQSLEGFSSDKLEELRLLHRTQKRKQVQVEDSATDLEDLYNRDKRVLAEVRQGEHPAYTRTTVLSKGGADFSFALKLFNDHVLRPKDHKSSQSGAGASASGQKGSAASGTAGGAIQAHQNKFLTPIIIVPATLTSIVSIINVLDLLEKGNYVSIEEKKTQGAKKEQEVYIRRSMPTGETYLYKVGT
jgi:hypothetical protein